MAASKDTKAGVKALSRDTVLTQEEKLNLLAGAVKQIEREFGQGAIMKLGESGHNLNIEAIPTGSLSLDIALGIGGVPRGRIVEIYGPESSGKTTVALHIVAEAQKRGGIAGFIDAEHALDPVYAKNIGVDIDNLYISQPDNGEQALEIVDTMVRSGALDVIVVDSVAALVPKKEIEGDMGDSVVGLQARLMSQALRKLTGSISRSNCVVIFINQLREKVGVVYGNPEVTTGGRALKFYSSVRMNVRKIDTLKQGTEPIGNRVKVRLDKNKVAPPFKEAEFDIIYGKGIVREGDVLDLAVKDELVEKSGAWYAYQGAKIGQGRENAKQYLVEHPEVFDALDHEIRKKHGLLGENAQDAGADDNAAGEGDAAGSKKKAAAGDAGTPALKSGAKKSAAGNAAGATGANVADAQAGDDASEAEPFDGFSDEAFDQLDAEIGGSMPEE